MSLPENHWLYKSTIAHRGLHNDKLPENSMSAFYAAMEKEIPIEIDVQLTKDGKVVIFHDDNTLRMCGVDKKLTSMTYAEVSELRLSETEERIPLFSDLLDVCTVPILVEIKNMTFKIGPLEQAVCDFLVASKCEYAVQSFNPFTVVWLKNHAPEILRGQLSSYYDFAKRGFRRWMLKSLQFCKISVPNFISYDEANMPNKYVMKFIKKHPETTRLCWTVKSQLRQDQLWEMVDGVIFESYLPENI